MSIAPKYKKYPSEKATPSAPSSQDAETEKKEVELLKKKIEQLLRDPKQQKKASQIIENLIKKSK